MIDRESRKAKRVVFEKPLKVVLSSIGSDIRYEFQTVDMSMLGVFLKFDDPNRLPFSSSSLLEVWVDLGEGHQVVFFNAKVVRVVAPGDELAKVYGTGVGLRIVDIKQKYQTFLEEYLSKFMDPSEVHPTDIAKAS